MNTRSIGCGLRGRMGLYTSPDGYIVERDEASPGLQAWIVSGPGIATPETVVGLQAIRRCILSARRQRAECA